MYITPFEQSGFIIETNNGFRLALDIGSETPLERLNNEKGVHMLLVSHIHGDHFSLPHIQKIDSLSKHLFLYVPEDVASEIEQRDEKLTDQIETTLQDGQGIKFYAKGLLGSAGVYVKPFSVDHGPNVSSPVKYNYGFLIELEGKKIYFAGDMYYESGIDVSELEVDYALIPIGGHYTFGPQEAFEFVKKFKSIKKLVPMHYEYNQEARGEFESLVGEAFDIFSREERQ